MGNQGTFTKNFRQIATNFELLYHLGYLACCVLALFMHPFFYSVLVIFNNYLTQEQLIKMLPISVVRCGVPRRDASECHQVGDPQRSLHHFDCGARPHPRLHVLHHWLHVLPRRFPCGSRLGIYTYVHIKIFTSPSLNSHFISGRRRRDSRRGDVLRRQKLHSGANHQHVQQSW